MEDYHIYGGPPITKAEAAPNSKQPGSSFPKDKTKQQEDTKKLQDDYEKRKSWWLQTQNSI